MTVASLGMYDSSALHGANDGLWRAIAGRLRAAGVTDVPDTLDRSRTLETIWDDPGLLLAQTCGYPLTTHWQGRLRVLATPRYRAIGCEGIAHRSRIVVRRDEDTGTLAALRARTVAVNDRGSNTGMNLLRAAVAPLAVAGRFFGAVVETGSHAASARAVATGDADVAAIDAVTFAHLEREAPGVTGALRTLAWSAPSPGLPFVTSIATPRRIVAALRRAIAAAIADEARDHADALLLDGIEIADARRYATVRTLERRAIRAGYPHLA